MRPARRVWIGLGSNFGPRRATLQGALEELDAREGVRVVRRSEWVETDPVGGPADQPPYLNGVAELACELAPRELLRALQAIEARHGRDRAAEVRHGPRTLDLDVLFYGDEEVHEPDLVIPHPRLEERTFVLRPLASLDPERRLSSGLTVRERLAQLAGEER